MKFSVIIPVYNIEDYIENCLQTILNQSFTDYEIILINDGSSDHSKDICEEYVKNYSNIKLIDKENGGPSSARRAGVERAEGDYIICVDGDDYIHRDLFLKIDNCIDNNPDVDLVCFGYYKDQNGVISEPINNQLREGVYTDIDQIRRKYLYDDTLDSENTGCMIYSLWCKAIKRNIFEVCQNYVTDKIKNGEDNLLTACALSIANNISVIDFAGYYYRDNQNSITHVRKAFDLVNVTNVAKKMENIGVFPLMNVAHNYLYSIYILAMDMARQSASFDEFIKLINYLEIDNKYNSIKPYGSKLKYRYRIKYKLIQKKLWRVLYVLSRVH